MQQLKIDHFGLTDIGNVRKANEDNLGFVESMYGPIFTVCDGMGGHVGGAVASELAVKTILEFISRSTVDNPSVSINNALISANQKILETAADNPDLKGMGTTATVLVVQPEGVYIGHVGDSRIYIYSNDKLHRLTKDHSFVQTLVDGGAITEEEAESHPRKNELLKALGVKEGVQPSIVSAPIRPVKGDIFLLCTDGLCGLVNDHDIRQIIAADTSLDNISTQLIRAAKDAGGFDNITVQLVRITESPFTESVFQSYSIRPEEKGKTDFDKNAAEKAAAHRAKLEMEEKKEIERKKKKRIRVLAGALVLGLLLVTAFAYYTQRWPFLASAAGKDSLDTLKPGTGELLPGDKVREGYLLHTVSDDDDGLKDIIKARKNINKKPYTDIDFGSTFSDDGESITNDSDLEKFPLIKWKFKPQQENVPADTRIVVASDTGDSANHTGDPHIINAPPKDTAHPSNKPARQTGADSVSAMNNQLNSLKASLAATQAKLQEAGSRVQESQKEWDTANDSLKAGGQDGSKHARLLLAVEKARIKVNKAKNEKQRLEAQSKEQSDKIEALEKKLKGISVQA